MFKYDRLTSLNVEDQALCSLDRVMDGDCIVCFNKNDVYSVILHSFNFFLIFYLIFSIYLSK